MIVYIFQEVLTIKIAQEIIQRTLPVYQPAILIDSLDNIRFLPSIVH